MDFLTKNYVIRLKNGALLFFIIQDFPPWLYQSKSLSEKLVRRTFFELI